MSSHPPSATHDSRSKASKPRPPRSVSTMTPTQLARKRALDRASQRATRARTREHIERLEQEVYELRVTTAAKSNCVDYKTLQELHRRNQALRQELDDLKRAAAADPRASSVFPPGEPKLPSASVPQVPQGFDSEMRSQWRLQSQTRDQSQLQAHNAHLYGVSNSTIPMDHSAVPRVSNALPSRAIHATTAEQQCEWLTPGMWNSTAACFSIPESAVALQAPQQLSPPPSHGFGCTCTHEIISAAPPTPEGQLTGQMPTEYTSMGLQQTALPLDWGGSDTSSNTSWQ